jgi:hypothetical protein
LEKEKSRRDQNQANKGGEQAQRCFCWIKTALQTRSYVMARCPDAKSTVFSTILAVSFSLVHAI